MGADKAILLEDSALQEQKGLGVKSVSATVERNSEEDVQLIGTLLQGEVELAKNGAENSHQTEEDVENKINRPKGRQFEDIDDEHTEDHAQADTSANLVEAGEVQSADPTRVHSELQVHLQHGQANVEYSPDVSQPARGGDSYPAADQTEPPAQHVESESLEEGIKEENNLENDETHQQSQEIEGGVGEAEQAFHKGSALSEDLEEGQTFLTSQLGAEDDVILDTEASNNTKEQDHALHELPAEDPQTDGLDGSQELEDNVGPENNQSQPEEAEFDQNEDEANEDAEPDANQGIRISESGARSAIEALQQISDHDQTSNEPLLLEVSCLRSSCLKL